MYLVWPLALSMRKHSKEKCIIKWEKYMWRSIGGLISVHLSPFLHLALTANLNLRLDHFLPRLEMERKSAPSTVLPHLTDGEKEWTTLFFPLEDYYNGNCKTYPPLFFVIVIIEEEKRYTNFPHHRGRKISKSESLSLPFWLVPSTLRLGNHDVGIKLWHSIGGMIFVGLIAVSGPMMSNAYHAFGP